MRLSLPINMMALALAACTTTTPLPSRNLGPDPAFRGGAFNTGTRLDVAAETFSEAGKVAVCAAWAADDVAAMAKPYLNEVLSIGVVQLAGRNVLQGFKDFPRAQSAVALPQAPGCVLTDHDWRPEYAALRPEIRFASIVLERDHDKLLSSVVVSFTGY